MIKVNSEASDKTKAPKSRWALVGVDGWCEDFYPTRHLAEFSRPWANMAFSASAPFRVVKFSPQQPKRRKVVR